MPLSAPINLMHGLEKGIIKHIHVTRLSAVDDCPHPDTGKHWLIMSGNVIHKTGTDSWLFSFRNSVSEADPVTLLFVKSTVPDDTVCLNSGIVIDTTAGSIVDLIDAPNIQWLILTDEDKLYQTGAAGVEAFLRVLEW